LSKASAPTLTDLGAMASNGEAFELLSLVASGIIVAIVVCARAMRHA
jgi:hypothetical protein